MLYQWRSQCHKIYSNFSSIVRNFYTYPWWPRSRSEIYKQMSIVNTKFSMREVYRLTSHWQCHYRWRDNEYSWSCSDQVFLRRRI
jgi:hypothetical protein